MKVFADTNFLLSAHMTRGLSHEVYEIVKSQHEFQTGEFNLIELRRILIEKFKVPMIFTDQIEQELRAFYIEPMPNEPSSFDVRDPEDRWVLASAINAKAEVLITGDKDLLVLADVVSPLRILTPRQFWDFDRRQLL